MFGHQDVTDDPEKQLLAEVPASERVAQTCVFQVCGFFPQPMEKPRSSKAEVRASRLKRAESKSRAR